jgi:hypothetical protein
MGKEFKYNIIHAIITIDYRSKIKLKEEKIT